MKQSTGSIFLVRPSNFIFNDETAASNTFQNEVTGTGPDSIQQEAVREFDGFAATLKEKGINVLVFDDTIVPHKPDAIFPNNWVTLHEDGTVILYPMHAHNRRHERRPDIIDSLKKQFSVTKVIDLSKYEDEDKFLEGTGSIIFDHTNKIAYACLSPRTDKELFVNLAESLHYEPVYFHSYNAAGIAVYHTNVIMCLGEKFAVICLESITDEAEREKVTDSLAASGHEIISITLDQVNHFAGNMLTLKAAGDKEILVLSQSAFNSLDDGQKQTISKYAEAVPIPINTIETIGGGSARCMIAEIFLPEKRQEAV